MASEFTIERIRGTRKHEGGWGSNQDLTDEVSLVKFVSGIFLEPDGDAEGWAEIVVGNDSDTPIRVDEIDVSISDVNSNFTKAPSSSTTTDPDDPGYLWREEANGWESMYEDHRLLGEGDGFFDSDDHDREPGDRLIAYTLGEDESTQRVISTPVDFTPPDRPSIEDSKIVCHLYDFRTLETDVLPTLSPKDTTKRAAEDSEEKPYQEFIDAISLWVKWDATGLTEYDGGGRFSLLFNFQSDIGQKDNQSDPMAVNHFYGYYTLPPGGRFVSSNSEAQVSVWGPLDERKMFTEWWERYGIKNVSISGSTDSVENGGGARMYRSDVEGVSSVKNSLQYEVPNLTVIDDWLKQVTGLVMAIGGSLVLSALFENVSITNVLLGTFVVVGIVLFLFWIHQTDSLTRFIFEFYQQWRKQ